MDQHIQLFKGIFEPRKQFLQYREYEYIEGILQRFLLIALGLLIVSFIGSIFGFGTEHIQSQMATLPTSELEGLKIVHAVGAVIGALFFPALGIVLSTFLLKIFFRDVSYNKLFAIQVTITVIYLLSSVIELPFLFLIGTSHTSSIFGFGIIGQYLFTSNFMITLMSDITLFSIWGLVIQIIALRTVGTTSGKYIVGVVLGVNVFILLLATTLTTITNHYL